MIKNTNILVCLPVYNEEKAIDSMINLIQDEGFELVITDGGSKDKSIEIAEKKGIKILHRPNRGKGYGMKQAMQYAKNNGKEIIVFIDCDMTYPVNKIKDLIKALDDADMSIGVRDRSKMSARSRFLNSLLSLVMKVLYNKQLKDAASGFRALKLHKFINRLTTDGMDLELEISGFAFKKNYKISEIAVDYYERVGESKLYLSDIIKAGYTILKTRLKKYK
jgi:glycosyltransferase involved in cell wall biosynthesis